MLISRLSEVQAVFIYIVLCHRVYQVGDVPVQVYVFSYSGGTDILEIFFKGQADNPAGYRITHRFSACSCLFL